MKRLIFLAALLILAAGCVSQPDRPIEETTRDTHPSPSVDMVEWKINHGEVVTRNYGEPEIIPEKCAGCHQPENFCNNCHRYVGDAPILMGIEGEVEAPPEEAPEAKEAALHQPGRCGACHEAPTMSEMSAGAHKKAFEKQPEQHRDRCQECHSIESYCIQCHEMPEVMKAPEVEAPEEAEEAPEAKEAALHQPDRCGACHEAPTMSEMSAGVHKKAFEKQPEIHKPICQECHDVESFCIQCHSLPEVMK